MKEDLEVLADVFADPLLPLAKVTKDAFAIGGDIYSQMRGTVTSWHLVRKHFANGRVVCSSRDGFTASSGKSCEECGNIDCRPRIHIRLQLSANAETQPANPRDVFLELNHSSSKNFVAYARDLAAKRLDVDDVPVILSVVNMGTWGMVQFGRDPDQLQEEPACRAAT